MRLSRQLSLRALPVLLAVVFLGTALEMLDPTKASAGPIPIKRPPGYIYLHDPGPGKQGKDHYVPRARNAKRYVLARYSCKIRKPCVSKVAGYRKSDSVSGDHPNGKAIDITIATKIGRDATGDRQALGWEVAKNLRSNSKKLGIKYIIWDNKIWSQARNGEGWRTYCSASSCPYGSHPSLTQKHRDHIHVSVK